MPWYLWILCTIAYILGYLATARIIFFLVLDDTKTGQAAEDDRFISAAAAVVVSILWPVIAAIVLALGPFVGAGWLISRPTRAQRHAAAAKAEAEQLATTEKLATELDLPNPVEV